MLSVILTAVMGVTVAQRERSQISNLSHLDGRVPLQSDYIFTIPLMFDL
jgi:hypothetical protein